MPHRKLLEVTQIRELKPEVISAATFKIHYMGSCELYGSTSSLQQTHSTEKATKFAWSKQMELLGYPRCPKRAVPPVTYTTRLRCQIRLSMLELASQRG